MYISLNGKIVVYRIGNRSGIPTDPVPVISHIYEDYSGDIIMVANTWDLSQINTIEISLFDDWEGRRDIYDVVVSEG